MYYELLQQWERLSESGCDSAIVSKIQEQLVARAAVSEVGHDDLPLPVDLVIFDDTTLSALDNKIEAITQVTGAILM